MGILLYIIFILFLLMTSNCDQTFHGCCSALTTNTVRPRTVLVTGANKGIGKEIARQLAQQPPLFDDGQQQQQQQQPWKIFLASRNVERGKAAVQELQAEITKASQNGNSIVGCYPLDLTDDASIQVAHDMIARDCGGSLDVLINNAAICFNDPTLYGKVNYTPFERQAGITVRTNFFGTLEVTRTMLPLLQQSSSPRIINIASAAGRWSILKSQELVNTLTAPDLQLPQLEALMQDFVIDVEAGKHAFKGWPNTCYGMSKLGIIVMTRILARDYPQMMINTVDPGYCATDQNNHQGYLPASQGAVAAVQLATMPASKFVTAQSFASY